MNNESTEQSSQNEVKNGNYTMESIRSMVRQLNEIDDKIKELRDDRKQIVTDFVEEYNVPMKEVKQAISMAKADIDPAVVASIYANIADLVEQK